MRELLRVTEMLCTKGSPIPGPWTSTCLWPIGNWTAQKKTGGRWNKGDVSPFLGLREMEPSQYESVKTNAKQARVEVISICDGGPEPT